MENKTKNTNSSKTIITVLIAIIALLLIVIGVLLWMLLGKSDGTLGGKDNNIFKPQQNITIGNADDSREAIEIVTKYGVLYYPLEWEENLRTEIIDEDEYKVEFYGTLEGKEEKHLFDLLFNGTHGVSLGTLTTENGENVAINIESYPFDLDDTWTEDERIALYAMVEDINYTIGMLSEGGNFTLPE